MSILEREKLNRPTNEDMLRGIEKWKYPSYYQKEEDIINESYDSYIKDEFMDIIKKHYNLYDIEEKEDILSKTYLDELIDLSNTEYIIENNSAYVYNIESIIEYLNIEKVKEYFNIEFFEE